jgi:hypothetical protein
MRLAPAQSHRIIVDPSNRYVDSSLDVASGEIYDFAATGKWRDAGHVCGPEGWCDGVLFRVARVLNRVSGVDYFVLCGCLDRDSRSNFAIRRSLDAWKVTPSGESRGALRRLHFFANDWPWLYGNNYSVPPEQGGPLEVTIVRKA